VILTASAQGARQVESLGVCLANLSALEVRPNILDLTSALATAAQVAAAHKIVFIIVLVLGLADTVEPPRPDLAAIRAGEKDAVECRGVEDE